MRRLLVAWGVAVSWAPAVSAERIGLFEILRHEVQGEGWIQLFDGSPVETDSVSGNDPSSSFFGFGAFDFVGIPPNISSIGIAGHSSVGSLPQSPEHLRIWTDLSTDYIGSGPIRPGAASAGESSSIIEFVMPVDRVQWGLILYLDETPGFSQSSMVTVENVTTGEILLSTTEGVIFLTEYVGHTGDVIRVTSAYTVEGVAPANASGLWYSDAILQTSFIVPEHASLVILVFGMGLWLSAYKRGPR